MRITPTEIRTRLLDVQPEADCLASKMAEQAKTLFPGFVPPKR